MKYIRALINKSFATEKTKKLLEKYERACEDENLKELTKKQNAWTIERIISSTGKPIEDIASKDLSDYFIGLKSNKQDTYVNHQKATMKGFFNKLGMKRLADSIKLLKARDIRKLPKNLVDRKTLKKMMQVCDNSRDRALLFFLRESGARKSEALALNIGDLIADEYGFVSVINGKTGERRIRIIEATPDLRIWLNDHPGKGDPKSPLWCSLSPHGYGKRLHKESLQQIFKTIANRARVSFNVYPHLMRHSRATELASLGFNDAQLCKAFGWEFGSPMPRIYIQRAGVDIDSKLLEANGIKQPDKKELKLLKAVCPECGKPQSPVASFCFDCGAILETEPAQKLRKKEEPTGIRKELEETNKRLEVLIEFIKNQNPDIKTEVEKRLKE